MTNKTNKNIINIDKSIISLHNIESLKGRVSHTKMSEINVFSFTNRFNYNNIQRRFLNRLFSESIKTYNHIKYTNLLFGCQILYNTTRVRKNYLTIMRRSQFGNGDGGKRETRNI